MRESIPRAAIVDTGFRMLAKRIGSVQRSINGQAATCMRAGDYDTVQRWMGVGKNVADFAHRVDAFEQEWKRLVKATRIAASRKTTPTKIAKTAPQGKKATPASRFYEPAIKALAELGGEATSKELLESLEAAIGSELTKADRQTLPRRRIPRWQRTMESVYRDCVREGWIEKRRDRAWKITDKGRRLVA